MRDKRLRIDRLAWLAGFVAGEAGRPVHGCPAGQDVYSWHSGWVEGDAKRQCHEYSLGVLTPADVDEYKAGKPNHPQLIGSGMDQGKVRIPIDRKEWIKGFQDGVAGRRTQIRPDGYSYHSGYIEGQAKRQGHEYSLGELKPEDVEGQES
jgi:ribosome modulation factor